MLIADLGQYFFGITIFVTSVFLVLLVLVQRGRGGGLTGALGGPGGQSAFGTKAGDLFTRITVCVAAVWIVLCAGAVFFLKKEPLATGLSDDSAVVDSSDTSSTDDSSADSEEDSEAAAETTPVGTDPVGTDPVGTDPVGTDPVGTPSESGTAAESEGTVDELGEGGSDTGGAPATEGEESAEVDQPETEATTSDSETP